MSNGYNTYSMLMERITRLANKTMKKRGAKKKMSMQQMVQFMYHEEPSMVKSMDFQIMGEELFWMNNGCNVIFPEDIKVLDRIKAGKYDLTNHKGFQMPHESFMLAFPKGYEIAGVPAKGCLVTWMRHIDRYDQLHLPMAEYAGLDKGTLRPTYDPKDTAEILLSPTAAVNYIGEHDGLGDSGQPPFCRSIFPQSKVPSLLKCRDIKDYREIMKSIANKDNDHEYDLNEDETQYQFELFKLLASISVYTSAFGQALESGFPGKRPKFLEGKDMPKFNDLTLSAGGKQSPHSHYRSWHIRQLNHAKYYQGEYEQMEPGSRMVFVRESFVGQDVNAETLKEV